MPRKNPNKGNRKRKQIDTNLYNIASDEENETSPKFRGNEIRRIEAIQLLNSNRYPSKFRFRDLQIQKIEHFIDEALKKNNKDYKFLMITGPPGAGKSLSTNHVLSKKNIDIIKINANVIKKISDVQDLIAERLMPQESEQNISAIQIIRALQERELQEKEKLVKDIKRKPLKRPCVVYIEEIELLFKSDSKDATQSFLTLFSQDNLKMILIGISNTIDTLQKYFFKFSIKLEDVENIVFKPYTVKDIMEIITEKFDELELKTQLKFNISEKLRKFVAIKLESTQKGDFRQGLQFLKDLIIETYKDSEEEQSEFQIRIESINNLLKEKNMLKDSILGGLLLSQQALVIGLYSIIKRTEAIVVTMKELSKELKWICECIKMDYSRHMVEDGLHDLEQYRIVQYKKKLNDHQILLKVSLAEIENCFGDHFMFKKFLEVKT